MPSLLEQRPIHTRSLFTPREKTQDQELGEMWSRFTPLPLAKPTCKTFVCCVPQLLRAAGLEVWDSKGYYRDSGGEEVETVPSSFVAYVTGAIGKEKDCGHHSGEFGSWLWRGNKGPAIPEGEEMFASQGTPSEPFLVFNVQRFKLMEDNPTGTARTGSPHFRIEGLGHSTS